MRCVCTGTTHAVLLYIKLYFNYYIQDDHNKYIIFLFIYKLPGYMNVAHTHAHLLTRTFYLVPGTIIIISSIISTNQLFLLSTPSSMETISATSLLILMGMQSNNHC